MEGQHHLWNYYINLAENRQIISDVTQGEWLVGGAKYAEAFESMYPVCKDEL